MNNSSTNSISETSGQLNARFASEFLPLTIFLGVLATLGAMGNILTLRVFYVSKDYKRRNSFRMFVIALALIDLISCLTLIPVEIFTHRYYFMFTNATICKTKCFLTVSCASASSLALLVISIDRYRKVMYPFKKQLTTSLSVKVLFIFAFILPVLISSPAIVMCGINKTFKTNVEGVKTEINICETEEKYKNSMLRIIYKFVLLISQLGISVVYVVLYSFVMKEAWKHTLFEKSRLPQELHHIQDVTKDSTGEFIVPKPSQNTSTVDSRGDHLINKQEKDEDPNGLTFEILPENTEKVKGTNGLMSKQSQHSMTSQQTKLPAKTLIWFVLTLIFILTFMLHLGLTFRVTKSVKMSTNELVWFSFLYRLYFIIHVINPVVYAIFLKNFRDSCRHLLTSKFNA